MKALQTSPLDPMSAYGDLKECTVILGREGKKKAFRFADIAFWIKTVIELIQTHLTTKMPCMECIDIFQMQQNLLVIYLTIWRHWSIKSINNYCVKTELWEIFWRGQIKGKKTYQKQNYFQILFRHQQYKASNYSWDYSWDCLKLVTFLVLLLYFPIPRKVALM